MNNLKLKVHKLLHWEYWDMKAIYYPIFPVWLYFAIRARSFFFFSAANPSIKNGGMAMESKKEIYDLIPSQYIPKTILIKQNMPINEILETLLRLDIRFPLIAKPDIGMKAFGVYNIEDMDRLQSYIHRISDDFLIQELIEYPKEVGIFYVRLPTEKSGRITGIVSKEFLSVIGNGKDSILQLIKQNPRSYFQLASLKKKYGNTLDAILAKGKKFILVPYGSHTRGAKFFDDSDKASEKLLHKIDSICSQIPGFYYGRLDVLFSSFEELSMGKKFSIIEINGAGSEPTHIYDPRHSLFFAWKEIIRHWKLLYQISRINNQKGHGYLSYKDGTAMLRANSKLEAKLKLI
ncbi:D-alanine--D-alanine ligase [Arenibacter sp. TNZ]|uniref:D-alanine--D-alanine ligase n=1 Tax=Arenibacter TaxID=178469 RepID=UPI000CD41655|nr:MULTISPECIES: D-alanine--D-alanine ligase [Arenibacter]MCM4171937.1 D-alanine--D-alanine ligase [Arenibacter sp. TNZ]